MATNGASSASATPTTSIKDRISALNINQLAHPPSYSNAVVAAAAKKSRPPIPPKRQTTSQGVDEACHTFDNGISASRSPEDTPKVQTASSGASGGTRFLPPPVLARAGGRPTPGYTESREADAVQGDRKPSVPSLPPPLPLRRPTDTSQSARRASVESTSSVSTTMTNHSINSDAQSSVSSAAGGRMVPPAWDPSNLPAISPNRTKEEKQLQEMRDRRPGIRISRSSTANVRQSIPPASQGQVQAPALPSRPALPARPAITHTQTEPQLQTPPQVRPARRSALEMGLNKTTEMAPALPSRPGHTAARPTPVSMASDPPPVPLASRPNLSASQLASKPKFGTDTADGSCLKCRDFSAVDAHAARLPREAIAHLDISGLAAQLTSPFSSATDKARAIFTWLHHNVAYDVDAFFNDRVQPSTPDSTLRTGLAVCEGYAGLFAALAIRAGLEAIVVTGHGKGYGHTKVPPNSPIPPFNAAGHAWSAVRLDDYGGWKLLDPCWGAGSVSGKGHPYTKCFKPEHFTMDNNEFGLRHFPADQRYFFRTDGRASLSWEEYIRDEDGAPRPQVYSGDGGASANGFAKRSFRPEMKTLVLRDLPDVVRFQFERTCPHWDPIRNGSGPAYVIVLSLPNGDGKFGRGDNEKLVFETDGRFWWCDVPRGKLERCVRKASADGRRDGESAKLAANCISSFDGRCGRGLSAEEFRRRDGKVGMEFRGLAQWEVV